VQTTTFLEERRVTHTHNEMLFLIDKKIIKRLFPFS